MYFHFCLFFVVCLFLFIFLLILNVDNKYVGSPPHTKIQIIKLFIEIKNLRIYIWFKPNKKTLNKQNSLIQTFIYSKKICDKVEQLKR